MPASVKDQVLEAFASEVQGHEDQLQALLEQIQRYGRVVNLTGSLQTDALWREFAEALLAFRALESIKLQDHRWIDIGSGGGLPGLLFGILLGGRPDTQGLLIEPRKRRADFLRLTIAQRGISNLGVLQATLAEDGSLSKGVGLTHPNWVSARAVFAPEQWLERAEKAWPQAHCMIHGQAPAPKNRVLKSSASWTDHTVEIWSPIS